ncbi:gliding motility-associated C-terminal domain-containing protein [Pedobacter sp. HDW13]|uniref:gliding motility-associated C-terminal domain-containing protein n=1 Tax=Pedobacter sp. HDW13 TaxID=2714940 RepID=UPI00140CDEF2|nr:gliding motility-associated C-terminal domain-containing protein [Pedobacter sp. HDW13]QIL38397.1 gliding motility-associated C-terminal domain-containing protein [Pedobacter sp. HDW13]
MRKIIALVFVFILCSYVARAAIFTVSSSADSGIGSLRETLQLAAANGSAETDYIYFNITNQPVLISIVSPLILSSNLVIDATTLPGPALGLSSAKVTLKTSVSYVSDVTPIGFSGTSLKNLEIYGFYFSFFANAASRSSTPISLNNCENIIIGAPNKGNVYGKIDVNLSMFKCNKIKVSNNWFAFNPERTELLGTAFGSMLRFYQCDNILIGGDTKAEGNQCGYIYRGMLITGIDPSTQSVQQRGEICVIKNNVFGDELLKGGLSDPHIIQNFKKVELLNNFTSMSAGFSFKDISVGMLIQGNSFGVGALNTQGSYAHSLLDFDACNNVLIGGKDAGQANILANNKYGGFGPGIYATNCGDILLQRNSIYCTAQSIVYKPENSKVELPVINITNYSNGVLTGTATPNSEIEVYTDGECMQCEAKAYAANTMADASGKWTITIPSDIGFTASASINNRTSKFLGLSFLAGNVSVKNTSCGLNNGYIKGLKVIGATRIEWKDSKGNLVGNTEELINVKPDIYTFQAFLGTTCKTQTLSYSVKDGQPQLFTGIMLISPENCNKEDGGIKNLFISNQNDFTTKSFKWIDEKGEVKGNSLILSNVKSGKYTLQLTTADDCVATFGPFEIPAKGVPLIDKVKVNITKAGCGSSNGSITNVIVSGVGKIKLVWKDEQKNIISQESELVNVPGGKYFLEVSDEGICGAAVYDFEIPILNAITIDDQTADIQNASCIADNGHIKKLNIISASTGFSFKWINESGIQVGDKQDLENLAAGKYTLIVDNGYCTANRTFNIIRQSSITYPDFPFMITPATCNLNNGSVKINTADYHENIEFRWLDREGKEIGNSNEILNLSEGDYQLYLRDENKCEIFYKTYVIERITPLSIDPESTHITNDRCGMGVGSVANISIKGGILPYHYTWRNTDGEIISTNIGLDNVKEGLYFLTITDNSNSTCSEQSFNFTISNSGEIISPPIVYPSLLCAEGEGIIRANANTSGMFNLYDKATNGKLLASNETGFFKLNILKSSTFFMSLANGTCESERAVVPIIFSEKAIEIPNSISPNDDGVNDTWRISNIDQYPKASIKIFNRNGNVIFTSEGYQKEFDGKTNGRVIAAGVYFYVINLAPDCKQYSGSLTIFL